MCGIAMSRLKMSVEDFWNITPKELYYAFTAYNNDLDMQIKNEWERTRVQTYFIIGDGKLTYKKFCGIFPLPNEKTDEDVVIPTQEEWNKLQEIYGGLVKGHLEK